jgi:hypothetical protein
MLATRTEVSFLSDAYNTTQSHEYFINEENYGEDVATAVMKELQGLGWKISAEADGGLGQEDHGWFFSFGRSEPDHTFLVGHVTGTPDEWVAWVEKDAGFLKSLFGGRQKGIEADAVDAVHQALKRIPNVQQIRWSARGSEDYAESPTG